MKYKGKKIDYDEAIEIWREFWMKALWEANLEGREVELDQLETMEYMNKHLPGFRFWRIR